MAVQPKGVRVVKIPFWDEKNKQVFQYRMLVREGHPAIKKNEDKFYPAGYVDIEV